MSEEDWDNNNAAPPPREPVSARGRRTRAKLLESGREALAERGHNNTRVDDVVSRAGTSHGTFYLYFENIEDLLAAVIEECDAESAELLTTLNRTRAGDIEEVAAVLGRFTLLRERYGEIASPWVQPSGEEPSRVESLTGHLDAGGDRAVATLALIDRALPELARLQADAPRRVAALVDTLRRSADPEVSPAL